MSLAYFVTTAALAFLLVVSIGLLQPSSIGASVSACPVNPSPPDSADPSVVVDEPQPGDQVTSPLHISGSARTFEANVRITIFAADGGVLADTFTTAAEAGPTLAPFETDVAFSVATLQEGCVRVFEESAMDGSPVNVVQVEVRLAPSTTPPTTGTGGLLTISDLRSYTLVAIFTAVLISIAVFRALRLQSR